MLRALVAHGVQPHLVVGSSVGAINATYFSARPDASGTSELERIWRGVRRQEVFPLSPWRSLAGLLAGTGYLADPRPLRKLLERTFRGLRLEETAIPCLVVATDILSGGEVVLDKGSVVDALLASSALPAVFPPVVVGGRALADGMLVSHTPISVAVGRGASRVIVLPTGHACAIDRVPEGAIASALHALNLIIARQLTADAERVGREVDLVFVPPLCPLDVHAHDFSRTPELIERAAESTREWLKNGGMEHATLPDALRPHGHDGRDP